MKWSVKLGAVPIAVRIDLPYCLYLQNAAYEVDIDGDLIQIDTLKTWRNSEESSDDDRVIEELRYFSEAHLISAPIGGDDGAQLRGKNMEFAGDRAGYFRFTRLTMGLTYSADIPPEQRGSHIVEMTIGTANRLIDVYRYASGRAYLPRLRPADLRFIQIQYPLTGELEYVGLFSQGLRIGVVNDGQKVHDEVRDLAGTGEVIPIHADLLMAASRALWETDFRLSVVEAASALEAFLDNMLRSVWLGSGKMSESEFVAFMNDEGRSTSDRMKKPLRDAGIPSPADDQELWARWLASNQLRGEVVHAGRSLTADEAATIVRTIQDLLRNLGDQGMHLAAEMPT
jgi:hypothetical protein